MVKTPPQFSKNPNFTAFFIIIVIIIIGFFASFFIYASVVEIYDKKANIGLIEASLKDYYKIYNKYPKALEELVSENFMNKLPTNKNGKQNYKYTPEEKDGVVLEYKLE